MLIRTPIAPGANSTVAARILSNTVGKSAFAPNLAWDCSLNFRHLAYLTTTQALTIQINGEEDGDYELTFSGGGLAAPVVLPAFAALGDTDDDIAAGLEAIIATARGTTLAGVVTNETVALDVITVSLLNKAPSVSPVQVTADFPGASTATVVYTYVGEVTVGDELMNYRVRDFYEFVVRKECLADVGVAFNGPDTLTLDVGYEGTEDAFIAAADLLTAGPVFQLAAAESAPRFAAGLVPKLTVTAVSTDSPLSFQQIDAGELVVEIHYAPVPEF